MGHPKTEPFHLYVNAKINMQLTLSRTLIFLEKLLLEVFNPQHLDLKFLFFLLELYLCQSEGKKKIGKGVVSEEIK